MSPSSPEESDGARRATNSMPGMPKPDRGNEEMKQAFEFATAVYDAVDTMDEKRLASFLTENCIFVFGNAEPVIGRTAAADYSKGFMQMIAGIKHVLSNAWSVDGRIISQVTVTYTRKDGKQMSFPAVTIWRMEGTQIADYRIYVDNSPLFAQ
jgi:ketosteroid isomerase-like protein